MNKEWVLFHLQEAVDELKRTIEDIQTDPSYGYPEFYVSMSHTYSHLNTAWNTQNQPRDQIANRRDSEFDAGRMFPTDFGDMLR